MKRTFPTSLPPTIAFLTIFAMLLAPLCGTLCTQNRCPVESTVGQLDADDCHHLTMDKNAGGASAIMPAMSCAQPETFGIAPDHTELQTRQDRSSSIAAAIAIPAQP